MRRWAWCVLAAACGVGGGGPVRSPAAPAAVSEAPPSASRPPPPRPLVLAAAGDVNLGGRVGELIAARGPDYPWAGVAPVLQGADLAVVNLECALSVRGSPAPKRYAFRGDPAAAAAMARAGVDVASVANNHSLDFGQDAFADTLAALRSAGIAAVGGGGDAAEAYRPALVERGGWRVAVLGATRVLPAGWAAGPQSPGVASAYEAGRLAGAVREAAAGADLVVVYLHWGRELSRRPDASQVRLGRALVDAGARVVLGAHPHVLQPVERYAGGVIAYSLGNFVFSPGAEAGAVSEILRIVLWPEGRLDLEALPVRISGGRPLPLRAAA